MKNKKLLSLAMLGLVSVGMFGCSQKPVPQNPTTQNEATQNQTTQNEVIENEVLDDEVVENQAQTNQAEGLGAIIAQIKTEVTEMPIAMDVTAEEFPMLYGEDLTVDQVEDFAILAPMMLSTTEVAIFKAKDGDTQIIKDALEKRIENQKGVFEQYLVDQYDIIANAKIFESGDYVYFISANETNFELMQNIIEDALNQ